jgi:hypothetical protein
VQGPGFDPQHCKNQKLKKKKRRKLNTVDTLYTRMNTEFLNRLKPP